MMYSDIPSAQTLVLFFKSKGIKNIVISPGSRNAPLTLGFTKNAFFSCYSIVDERCAGFFALGMAQQLCEPVGLLCTSGSAMLNYYPAVAEAYYSDIPLVVVSADRPSYKIDIGDGQTIRQENIFEKHIGYSANLKQDSTHGSESYKRKDAQGLVESQKTIQEFNETEIRKALNCAILTNNPVHINIPFEEPLYGSVSNPVISIPESAGLKEILTSNYDWTQLSSVWNNSAKKMVLIGVNGPSAIENKVLESLAGDDSVLVFTETTSNVYHSQFFPSIDSIIAPIEKSENGEELFKRLQPDLLITLGGLIVSKKIKAFLRKHQPKTHWHIDPKKAYDTFFCLTQHVKVDPNSFFKKITKQNLAGGSPYRNYWLAIKDSYEIRRKEYLGQIPFSDFKVFDQILQCIPKGYQLHLANSSTVRYTQLFPLDSSLEVYCNRGTSGIDGSTSTAMGAAVHHVQPTVLITGDLSFFYDSNGLWNSYTRPDFRIIIINNSGGGIFRILPGFEETEEFSNFFETSHKHSAKHLAEMYNFNYVRVDNEEGLNNALSTFYDISENPKILEIATPRVMNNKILLDYFDFIS